MQLDHNVICHFRFICSERWETLTPIEGYANKRFCGACNSPVYLTKNYEELEINISAKRCVAMFLEKPQKQKREFMGLVVPALRPPYSPDSLDPILTRSVVELELTPGILKKLQINNIKLLGDLAQCTKSQLTEQFGVTNRQLNELLEALVSRGLSLGMRIENWGASSAKHR
jgi:DNA-directed RNA polymerase alpha subunit